jgi:hypothetical protein
MRFRNSSDYFGRVTHAQGLITPNPAIGKAFHVIKEDIALLYNSISARRFFRHSQQCSHRLLQSHQGIVTEAIVTENSL